MVLDIAQANRLHNKSQLGTPQTGNTLVLGHIEAAWAIAAGRLDVGMTLPGYLAAHPGLEVPYLAYADLRGRGLPVRPRAPNGPGLARSLHVWPRGSSPKGAPSYTVECRAEREALSWPDLRSWAKEGRIVAVVDEDGDVTHYLTRETLPGGDVPPGRLPVATGEVLEDLVMVEGPPAAAYHGLEHVGTLIHGRLAMSFLEAEHLRRRGVLQVPPMAAHAARRQPAFPVTMPVYEGLRGLGVVARSGLKFGTHLRGYKGSPEESHAQWLVHCTTATTPMHWSDISRGVRVSHGVRKEFLVAVGEPTLDAVSVSWFRP